MRIFLFIVYSRYLEVKGILKKFKTASFGENYVKIILSSYSVIITLNNCNFTHYCTKYLAVLKIFKKKQHRKKLTVSLVPITTKKKKIPVHNYY